MKFFLRMVTVLVLGVWTLAALHRSLEALPGFDFLKCCCYMANEEALPRDCSDSPCSTVESGDYRIEDRAVAAPPPVLLLDRLVSLDEVVPGRVQSDDHIPDVVPPELAHTWQFSHRTAQPPRAPSLAS